MKMKALKTGVALLITALIAAATGCAEVPITGRQQLSLVSKDEVLTMSYQQYDQFLKENKVSTDPQANATVQRVGTRIQKAVEAYFAQKGRSQDLAGYKWEFKVVESKEVNAFCMPGGKVVVYTGILPVTKDDTGLAVVLGHEIAHAVANHGSERMSQELLAQFGGAALSEALSSQPAATQEMAMSAFGVGANVGVLLPYSRMQESEADRLGVIFMAMAGYDPQQAVGFWERMAAQSNGSAPPALLSTHPSDARRIADLKGKYVAEAMNYYRLQATP